MEFEYSEYSEGEDPQLSYDIDWDNIKTVKDVVNLFKAPMTSYIVDYSRVTEEENEIIESLIKKGILKNGNT